MNYSILDIAKIISARTTDLIDHEIDTVLLDTRQISLPKNTLFFAFPGAMNDGHNFIEHAYESGVRSFVVTKEIDKSLYQDANILKVDDALSALQALATHHRKTFSKLRTLAITGSNGKTIIKEWLYQMLHDRYNIVKSPKSYNSQIGMALSILSIESHHDLGIFEAGVSEKNEMEKHLEMLEPSIGLITNVGSAHDEGFANHEEKTKEKMSLFKKADVIIYRADSEIIDQEYKRNFKSIVSYVWGKDKDANVQIIENQISNNVRKITLIYNEREVALSFRFLGLAALENLMHCISVMLLLDVPSGELQDRINRISGLEMRQEMTSGINGSIIINDAYSADLDSLSMALEFTSIHAPNREKVAILSPFDQSGKGEEEVFKAIVKQLQTWGWSRLIYVSNSHFDTDVKDLNVVFYKSKEALLAELANVDIKDKALLIKGARKYRFEEISEKLSDKGHSATLSINLNHLEDNLRVYKRYLKPETGIIAVVKASAYGSGSEEVAQLLERNGVAYLAVAFADEGVALRKVGISTPIIVLNPDLNSLKDMLHYNLEPEVYDLYQLTSIIKYCQQAKKHISIHIKLDTGMHRLGFRASGLDELIKLLSMSEVIKVETIFSHLASSEDAADDDYTRRQFDLFEAWSDQLIRTCCPDAKRHILNSGGISRFPEKHYDFVRLGIGMYGLDHNKEIASQLIKVHSLIANIIQIKEIKAGESIGYNRKTILSHDAKIAIVNIGYADGLMRNLGNGRYSLFVNNIACPILGNVSMDLTIIDISAVEDAIIGDTVQIFGSQNKLEDLAELASTIPYEILSRISNRVQRKFVKE